MREFIIVGRPNSGKTMFTLNFAAYIGCKTVDVTFRSYDGLITCRHFSIEEAKNQLCGMALHKTRSVQSVILKIALGKTIVNFKITDTCGIAEKIHNDETIRRGMAQTLSLMRCADFIFHIVDASCVSKEYLNHPNSIDHEIYNYGIVRNSYTILANKVDLPSAQGNIPKLASLFPQGNTIPVSALLSQGFKEVKTCVARNI
ncbi:MAG: 50S ribosome-binding GTPase [Sporomusaceae bacterium]|nr:50S ribosome-binding GTPase [Sporomusaceae bacterium]